MKYIVVCLYISVPPRLCPYMIEPTRLSPHVCAHTRFCPDTFVPRNVCAQTRLCPTHCAHTRLCPDTFVPTHVCGPHTFVPRHDCANTRLCPDTFVPTQVCAQTRLCPHVFVPTHVCALTCYNCVVTIMTGHKCVWARILYWIRNKISTNAIQYIPNSSISLFSFIIWPVKIVHEARQNLMKRLKVLRVGNRWRLTHCLGVKVPLRTRFLTADI